MQVVCESDYQDIYRIRHGVLLVVNKFKRIDYSDKTKCAVHLHNGKCRKYNKTCQDCLKVLKEDHYDSWSKVTIPKDTVLYYGTPVELATDKSQYEYQIKTSGDYFSGNSNRMLDYINEIINVIKQG